MDRQTTQPSETVLSSETFDMLGSLSTVAPVSETLQAHITSPLEDDVMRTKIKEQSQRAWEHMHSPITIRSIIAVIIILSGTGFGYAVFNELRDGQRSAERFERLQALADEARVTHQKTDEILAAANERRKESEATLEYIAQMNANLRTIADSLKSHDEELRRGLEQNKESRSPKPTARQKKRSKSSKPVRKCVEERQKITPFGTNETLIERSLVTVPCKQSE